MGSNAVLLLVMSMNAEPVMLSQLIKVKANLYTYPAGTCSGENTSERAFAALAASSTT